MRVILFLMAVIPIHAAFCQSSSFDCNEISSVMLMEGQSFIAECDSVLVLSNPLKKEIDSIIESYSKGWGNNLDDSRKSLQDLKFAIDSYENLHESYLELSKGSQTFLEESHKTLTEVNVSLKNANELSSMANNNITEAIDLIKKEKNNKFWNDALKFGGGIIIGGAVGVLVSK